ncbi:lanthionine biosynthesis cyclase LanC [Corallococcus coralloides]|uniref:Lanthionine biosynthesis cyclase LanC n=1 Tax=Corallococcus coralloides TaxID=184914 RepID=A0A410RS58_CORCK|nr:lanthionine biosynthesis cyclase LanC [Corallococcus coralloides]
MEAGGILLVFHAVHRKEWQPILGGEQAARAWQVIEFIARDLRARLGTYAHDFSLSQGMSGIAVLFAYLSRAGVGADAGEFSLQSLERAMDGAASTPMSLGLYSGLTGVAWAAEHVHQCLFGQGPEDLTAQVMELVLAQLAAPGWDGGHDLVSGLVGLGVYGLAYPERSAAKECLGQVVRLLENSSERDGMGARWWTVPAKQAPHLRTRYNVPHLNLGMAHGSPGVIVLLARACSAWELPPARELLRDAVRDLLRERLPEEKASRFPAWVAQSLPPKEARAAWCYGDPGVAAALLWAARELGVSEWEREALLTACLAAQRPVEECRVKDALVCHGMAGLGHVFNRLYQATGEPRLLDAARGWFSRTLDVFQPGAGIGGYQRLELEGAASEAWQDAPGVLSGSAGVALTLLAATTHLEPHWDRMLLMDLPPGPPAVGAPSREP